MALRDLIFGRKAPSAPDGAVGEAAAPPEDAAFANGFAEARAPNLSAEAEPGPGDDDPAASAPDRSASLAVLGLILGGSLPMAERRRAVVDELSRALSLRHVALIGTDRSAHLMVANRRVLAARFLGRDLPLDIDMRDEPGSEPKAMVLYAALAELLSAPVDLMVETRPAAGVYAAAGGLPVDLLQADEAALRAAFAPPEDDSEPAPALANPDATP